MQPAASFGAGGRAPGHSGVLGSGFPSSSHRLNWERAEDRDNCCTSISVREASSFPETFLPPWRDDCLSSIVVTEAGSSPAMSLPSLVDGADVAHTSRAQPCLEHPRAGLEEQQTTQ